MFRSKPKPCKINPEEIPQEFYTFAEFCDNMFKCDINMIPELNKQLDYYIENHYLNKDAKYDMLDQISYAFALYMPKSIEFIKLMFETNNLDKSNLNEQKYLLLFNLFYLNEHKRGEHEFFSSDENTRELLQTFHEPGSLPYLIITDSIDEFINATSTIPDFDYNQKFHYQSLIDIAARSGSINCFKYLLSDGANVTKETLQNSFAGNNYEIIHILEEKHTPDVYCMNNAIKIHNNELITYLIDKYKLRIQYDRCANFFNVSAFLQMLSLAKNANYLDREGNSILIQITGIGAVPIMKFLIDKNVILTLQMNGDKQQRILQFLKRMKKL
ncbi:hypothetical protein TVAG_173330 [Trichomonas vaginalis G3]|uniref:DUF3447 domain-containing protein n=1 Tax=Trichomonas vaginalis (strain ATCC PRA-98 / G3) TaxID=412133 RepID=A2DF83_TRIV3|nr:spectrin binding [Trichomonas vaginalis G3]EAY21075.1 hypothetical protein TVAG_173330 [Trichomonas vaginalis G3]KAI5532815.1 spectrin binding [Trichomonas vaginalis G3]|eukprot:XP_001582061.1 hypothetical protein [Trichomonas vaginalis G3]